MEMRSLRVQKRIRLYRCTLRYKYEHTVVWGAQDCIHMVTPERNYVAGGLFDAQ